jgi:chemotaxis protein MotB
MRASPDSTELVMKEPGVVSRMLPWLFAAAALGFSGYLYAMVYRPLADAERKQKVELREQSALLRDAKRESDELRADLHRVQGEAEKAQKDLAHASASHEEDSKLITQLSEAAKQGEVEVSGQGGNITLTMVDKILFPSGEAELSEQGEAVLQRLGGVLKGVSDKLVQIRGHTDTSPIRSELKELYPTNWELSTARAVNVLRFLQEKVGMDPRRMMASGYGPYRPVASNASAAGKAKNRRIEILLVPETVKVVKGDFPALAGPTPAVPSHAAAPTQSRAERLRERIHAAQVARAKQAQRKRKQ